jgi:hypothetical protein
MRRHRVMMVLAGAAAVLCAAPLAATAAPAATWHTAIEVPGMATLNAGVKAEILSLSCGSAGNCAAGGIYSNSHEQELAFVVSETDGTWGNAIEVPGIAALDLGGYAAVASVSCRSAGNCAAGGYYSPGHGARDVQAFVVSESNGTWGKAIEVPGTAALNAGDYAQILTVSCGSAGNCAANGTYSDAAGIRQPFVVTETSGTWGTAIQVPGLATLDQGPASGSVGSLSCASAVSCTAGGTYSTSAGGVDGFVVSETDGTWHTAFKVPGLAALANGGSAGIASVSCPSAGNCTIGGSYGPNDSSDQQPFVASETNGTWHTPIQLPGAAALGTGNSGWVTSLSCPSAGNCTALGNYENGRLWSFVASETSGTWHTAIQVPGTAALYQGPSATASAASVSCASAGNCATGGSYFAGVGVGTQAWVASETDGTWSNAIPAPGTAALNTAGDAGVYAVSCGSAGNCAVGGLYRVASSSYQAFVENES